MAFWLQFGVKVGEAAKTEQEESEAVTTMAKAKDFVYGYYYMVETKDLVALMLIVTIVVQVAFKLIENFALGKLASGLGYLFYCAKKCCCKRGDDDEEDRLRIRLTPVTSSASATRTIHYMNCQYVKKMKENNVKLWRTCSECRKYVDQETERVIRNATEEVRRRSRRPGTFF